MFEKLVLLLTAFLGASASAEQFITEKQHAENLSLQSEMTPQTLAQLYQLGVTRKSTLKLEYFFFTNHETKAFSLHHELQEFGYTSEYGQSADNASVYIVTGWTDPIRMDNEIVLQWAETMCQIGFKHDVEFDGWGTHPEQ